MCSVLRINTSQAAVMIPAQYTCPSSWTREYYGYLMSAYYGYRCSTLNVWNDIHMQSIPGSTANTNGALFCHVEVECSYGIPYPPYDAQKEVMCVV